MQDYGLGPPCWLPQHPSGPCDLIGVRQLLGMMILGLPQKLRQRCHPMLCVGQLGVCLSKSNIEHPREDLCLLSPAGALL